MKISQAIYFPYRTAIVYEEDADYGLNDIRRDSIKSLESDLVKLSGAGAPDNHCVYIYQQEDQKWFAIWFHDSIARKRELPDGFSAREAPSEETTKRILEQLHEAGLQDIADKCEKDWAQFRKLTRTRGYWH